MVSVMSALRGIEILRNVNIGGEQLGGRTWFETEIRSEVRNDGLISRNWCKYFRNDSRFSNDFNDWIPNYSHLENCARVRPL